MEFIRETQISIKECTDKVVDFFCYSENKVIETDGSLHDDIGTQKGDFERDEKNKQSGIRIFHFQAIEIGDHLDNVLNEISTNFKPFDK